MIHVEEGSSHPENPLTYTVNSTNQHLVVFFNPDSFYNTTNSSYVNRGSSYCCTSYPGLTPVICFASCTDVFTTSNNYTGDISVIPKSDVKNYSFSVYEIFTDGTVTPGYDSEGGPVATSPPETTPGSSGDDETSKGIFDTVKNMFSKLKEIADNISNLPHNIAIKIGDFFTDIKNAISQSVQDFKDYLVYLFVPSDNNFEECKKLIDDKFKFVHQALDYYKNFVNFTFSDKPPETYVTIYGETISFMNWDLYDKYKPVIDNIIVFCAWFLYIRRLVKRIPGIIGGFHT